MMLSYPGENRTFRHSSKNSSTRKARKVYYVHQVIFNVHVQCIYETEFFFSYSLLPWKEFKKIKEKEKTVLWQRWFVWMRTPKKRENALFIIHVHTCMYSDWLSSKKKKIWKRRLRKSAYTCSCNNHWNLCCLLLDQR